MSIGPLKEELARSELVSRSSNHGLAAAKTMLSEINTFSQQESRSEAIACLQLLLDRCYSTGSLRKSRWLDHVEDVLVDILEAV